MLCRKKQPVDIAHLLRVFPWYVSSFNKRIKSTFEKKTAVLVFCFEIFSIWITKSIIRTTIDNLITNTLKFGYSFQTKEKKLKLFQVSRKKSKNKHEKKIRQRCVMFYIYMKKNLYFNPSQLNCFTNFLFKQ